METILKYFPDLTPEQRERFAALYGLYAEWNARINVVSRKDFEQLYLRHVLHSLAIARVCAFDAGARILDVGCGGGFPCVPLAILFPEARFTAVDSIAKKIAVVQAVKESRSSFFRLKWGYPKVSGFLKKARKAWESLLCS